MLRRNWVAWATKTIMTASEAVKDISSGDTVLVGGFGTCGSPHALAKALSETKVTELNLYTNAAAIKDWSIGYLFQNKQVARVASSHVGSNSFAESDYLAGDLEVEFTPQGSLAERMRAGGSGIPAFYTPTGVGTTVQFGGFPLRLNKDGSTAKASPPKEVRQFDGRWYLMEEAITGDFSLVKAWRADKAGNLQFRGTARNFNVPAAQAGKICIAEVEELVEVGELDPDQIHLPGVYVDRLVVPPKYKTLVEHPRLSKPLGAGRSRLSQLSKRERIQRRAALELEDGMYMNLGIGTPTGIPNFLPEGVSVASQAEHGVLGVGPFPETEADIDPDLINAGKETITLTPSSSTFSSDMAFGMIRGRHMDLTILGGMQVAPNGDLANWVVPGKMVKGMGGAMDLVSSGCRVVVTMEHTAKGAPKILKECNLPLTGKACVDRIITDLCVFDIDKKGGSGMTLVELAPGVTVEEVQKATQAPFKIADEVKTMQYARMTPEEMNA